MASSEFERLVEKACADLDIAGAAMIATNRDGSFHYSKSFGKATSGDNVASKPFQLDTVAWTGFGIDIPIVVEANNFSLDDPELIEKHLPELCSKSIIQAPGEDGVPGEAPRTAPITLRHLLTHTSGVVYDPISPIITEWAKAKSKLSLRGTTVTTRFDSPLAFEPGSSWMYGASIDFAGLFVERVTGETLEAYMKSHIWEPLGIKDMTFHLSTRSDMKQRFADMGYRTKDGKVAAKAEDPETERKVYLTREGEELEGCFGGDGVFTSAEEYIKVLRAVLDGTIIPARFAKELFEPQLNQAQAAAMNGALQIDFVNNAMGHTNKKAKKNWGLAGLLLDEDDYPKGRKEGTLIWAGLPMLSWFVDRKTDLCGIFATQLLPTGDQKAVDITNAFIEEIYELRSASGTDAGRL